MAAPGWQRHDEGLVNPTLLRANRAKARDAELRGYCREATPAGPPPTATCVAQAGGPIFCPHVTAGRRSHRVGRGIRRAGLKPLRHRSTLLGRIAARRCWTRGIPAGGPPSGMREGTCREGSLLRANPSKGGGAEPRGYSRKAMPAEPPAKRIVGHRRGPGLLPTRRLGCPTSACFSVP